MGIKITDVQVVGFCSKHRKEGDKLQQYKDGSVIEDKDIYCVACSFSNGGSGK